MKLMPNTLVSVDPGLRACGVAVFRSGKLEHATLVRNPVDGDGAQVWSGMASAVGDYLLQNGYEADVLVLELPQVYAGGKGKGDPNDLINLAAVVGGVATRIRAREKVAYLPRVWKGTVPKDVHNERTRAKLSAVEARALDADVPNYLMHNVLDAVGLGLYELDRT